MALEKISLEHRELLDGRFKALGTFISEYSFANLYLFRGKHDYNVLAEGGAVCVTGRTYDGGRLFMPTADLRDGGLAPLLPILAPDAFLYPVPEEWLGAFEGYEARIDFSEGDSDYVYTVEKLSTYQGQKLHSKKNLLNQFLSLYSPQARPLTVERMPDARDILEAWQHDVGEDKAATDYFPCREAFELYDELVLCGGIYYVDEEPAGFIIGEELNDRMFALHFAKGKRKFKGLYQYMYNHFAGIMPKKYQFFNFEQDLGILALKIAKSSYVPDRMLKKYRVRVSGKQEDAVRHKPS